MRSSMPPWPASSEPLSFTCMSRLRAYSKRSPTAAVSAMTNPSAMERQPSTKPVLYNATNATKTAVAVPATKPSHVFPGESVGARRWRPTRRPVKYAAVSAANTAMMTVNAASCPCSGRPRSRITCPRPRPTHPAPSTVEPTATVAELRVRATRYRAKASPSVARNPPSIHAMPPSWTPRSRRPSPAKPASASGRSSRFIPKYSWSAIAPATAPSATIHHPPSQTSPSTTGSRPTATTMRDQNALRRGLLSSAEAAAAARIVLQGGAEIRLAEVRPQGVDEDELGVCELPEQEVRDAELARGEDQQVRIWHVGLVQAGRERLLVDLVGFDAVLDEPARGGGQLGAAAVVERDPELEPLVHRRLLLERRHPRPQLGRSAISAADEPRPHALLCQVGELAIDRLGEDLHQGLALVRGPRPVLGRERVDGERLDAEVDRRLDRPPQRARPRSMAGRDRQAAAPRPAAVSVHDDRDRARDFGARRLRRGPNLPERANAGEEVHDAAPRGSDFHDLGFLVLQELVDRLRVLVGELLHLVLGAPLLVVADLAVPDELLEVPHDVSAHVPDRHLAVLGVAPHELDELLAPLLGELRDREADHLPVVRGLKAEG